MNGMIDAYEFAQKQLELTAEFGKFVFEHPEMDDQIPNGACVYFEIEGEKEFNRYSQAAAQRRGREEGVPVVRVRVKGLAPPQGSRLIDPIIEPAPAIA
jgi:hypothetical protein